MLDIELAWAVGFVLLAAAGLVYAAFSAYLYFRFERSDDMHVSIAISAFVMHYFLSIGSRYARGYVLLTGRAYAW